MSELPTSASTAGWTWRLVEKPSELIDGFWIGTDTYGNEWLTKLRGSFYAYREIVFGRLAQSIGWSCQSSTFIILDGESAHQLQRKPGEVHAAHWYLDEHTYPPCNRDCPLEALVGLRPKSINDLRIPGIHHHLDWPKGEIAAYICGGNEPPDRLYTSSHELVLIDSEQMFSTMPCPFDANPWLHLEGDRHNGAGRALAMEACREIGSIPPTRVASLLEVPAGVQINLLWPIEAKLQASIEFAARYAGQRSGA